MYRNIYQERPYNNIEREQRREGEKERIGGRVRGVREQGRKGVLTKKKRRRYLIGLP